MERKHTLIGIAALIGVALIALIIMRGGQNDKSGLPYGAVGGINQFITDSTLCLTVDGGCQTVDRPLSFFMGNMMKTDETGKMQAVLADQSVLTVGPNTELIVSEFIFDVGAQGRLNANLLKGAARLLTGQMGDMEDKEITVGMPAGNIGLRGTDVWFGEIDGAFSVLLIEGNVLVSTDQGSVVLDQPGQGVALRAKDLPPGDVKNWSEEKKARALARVELN